MAEALYELLVPHFDAADGSPRPPPPTTSAATAQYLNYIPTLDTASLTSTELQSLSQTSHSNLVSLQSLANRSHKSFITSADNHRSLQTSLPRLATETQRLRDAIPELDEEAVRFSSTYSKTGDSQILERRKKALQLARNVDRLSDILELPTLLSTAVSTSSGASSAAATAGSGGTSSSNLSSTSNYSAALDLFAHIKRLQTLYPESPLAKDIVNQAEDAMKDMTTNLISDLRVQNIRLAPAMRIIGWLRRIAPDLEEPSSTKSASSGSAGEGAFGALFLVCRLANLLNMLSALEPLRELADQETLRRRRQNAIKGETGEESKNAWSGGQQTERFLKKYIEIYREQSFAIVSLYKNIFAPASSESATKAQDTSEEPSEASMLSQLPPALATFPMHLAQLLAETLEEYLPNVRDKSSRESLLTQVLYCAASLGRLGGDFTMMLSLLSTTGGTEHHEEDRTEDEEGVPEWEEAIRKHRILAERLDLLTASGEAAAGSGAKGSYSSSK
ncbi:hypothetical protein MGYG_01244 [Nannizzia gypsea CBS 118893]|uniref:Conserved oligomeric Golgi complex subunit 8 n=1 Tax=Arthroderma gypseum (strain ATCC MYA-4604 / CBS 118893) TaxID=535722 RepID=E5QZQ7_ARTGP|nr:hypothetical protein MGYG_01244 [Nannizzia gypsea CBS 118893]EFQ98208.1 hypothetical protein MGYG_01244 [Nannizzia gypsea CBS 118893]